jgi:hypothetical protein
VRRRVCALKRRRVAAFINAVERTLRLAKKQAHAKKKKTETRLGFKAATRRRTPKTSVFSPRSKSYSGWR